MITCDHIAISLVLCLLCIARSGLGEIFDGRRIKGDDEPNIVSWRVLEGVTEPFESEQKQEIPAWKQLKSAADHKAASLMIQQALHEYGQLLRHPYMFGEMPMDEKYDVFLSMSKLLKLMGFHQRAELILYEAMSYTTRPYEAHMQLALLFLDKEDLDQAKVHLKNCLYFEESDSLILSHLAVVLISEGKMHEAKFFISRILSNLQGRVSKLSFLLSEQELNKMAEDMDYKILSAWVEDLLVKVYYGEFQITPSATVDLFRFFSSLYKWLKAGELSGRFIFDIGQSLYEGGRPKVGRMMMKRGLETANATEEGEVSTEIVNLRLSLDYSVIPDSIPEIIDAYLNMTSYLSLTSDSYVAMDAENILDVYWPLPLLWWSSLPVAPILQELMWRFEDGPRRMDAASQHWLVLALHDEIMDDFYSADRVLPSSAPVRPYGTSGFMATTSGSADDKAAAKDSEKQQPQQKQKKQKRKKQSGTASAAAAPKLNLGILGGHMNNHPVGHMILRKLLGLSRNESLKNSGYSADTPGGGGTREITRISVTLLALPLVSDHVTKSIASAVDNIVNLPMHTQRAWKAIEQLHLDVILFPDWQPFPDQQSLFFQSRRMAPVQVCLFVRGSSCGSSAIDYYLLPEELQDHYLNSVPAADIDSRVDAKGKVVAVTASEATAGMGNESFSSSTAAAGGGGRTRPVRPLWRERVTEQVILLDWPLLTPGAVAAVASSVHAQEAVESRRSKTGTPVQQFQQQQQQSYHQQVSSVNTQGPGDFQHSSSNQQQQSLDLSTSNLQFSPMDIEGKIFFEDQPVAVVPLYPTSVHPLMDNVIFKVLRSVPALHLVLALPESFLTHAHDPKHKISWARKLVRRLWTK